MLVAPVVTHVLNIVFFNFIIVVVVNTIIFVFVSIIRSEIDLFLRFCCGEDRGFFEQVNVLVSVVGDLVRVCVQFRIWGLVMEILDGYWGTFFSESYDCVCRSSTLK